MPPGGDSARFFMHGTDMGEDGFLSLIGNVWRRRLGCGLAVVLLVLFVAWLLPKMFNKRVIRAKTTDWAVRLFDFSSPASIGKVDLALRINGRTDLYVHDFELDTPNPRFDRPWLQVDTFRASAPVYTLLGGVSVEPVIQVRDGILRLEWDKRGNFNLAGLRLENEAGHMPIMNHLNIKGMEFALMKNRVIIENESLAGLLLFDGRLRVEGDELRLALRTESAKFELRGRGGGTRERFNSSIDISECAYSLTAQKLTALRAKITNIPLSWLNGFAPDLPLLAPGATTAGELYGAAGVLRYSGQVTGFASVVLPEKMGVELEFIPGREKGAFNLLLKDGEGGQAYSLQAARDATGWQTLKISCSRLNLQNFTATDEMNWLGTLFRFFRAARVEIGQTRYSGLDIGKISLDIVPATDRTANLSLSGEIAGGKLAVLARRIPLDREAYPESLIGSLSIPDARDTIMRFSGLFPPVLQCTPTGGSGELVLSYDTPAAGSETPRLRLRLELKNIRIPALTGGELVQELTLLPRRMVELENLCRRAQIRQPEALPLPAEGIQYLNFESLQASYDIAPDERGRLRGLLAQSAELGPIEAVGSGETDKSFRLLLVLRFPPAALTAANPLLSRELKTALAQVINDSGLKIECEITPEGGKVTPLYIQDVFRVWSENQSRQGAR